MKKHLLLFITLILNNFVVLANIKENVKDSIQDYLSSHFLNASFMFANDKEIISSGAKGLYSLDSGEQLSPNQKMPIASGTKSITAASILKLQEKGLLNVKDNVAKYLTKNSNLWLDNKVPTAASQITIHQLLTHTSGLVEYLPALKLDPNMSHVDINKSILNFAFGKPQEFKSGIKYKYSNTNYVLLGLIIEQVSGKTLANFFNDEIFVPLGMNSTHLASLEEALLLQRSPDSTSYPRRYFIIPNNTLKPNFIPVSTDFVLVPYADGGVISTPHDLITWHRSLHTGKILSKASYKLMITKHIETPAKNSYKTFTGYGLFISDMKDGNELIHHSGSAIAIRSEAGFFPQKNLYFAILSNIMVQIPKESTDKIDLTKPENQLDIVYFRDAILRSSIKETTDEFLKD